MFDFSFGEIGIVAVVALLVLGPERLPKVARTAGALLRRARSSWQNVRDEIERELAAEDLKKSLQEARQAAADLRSDFANASTEVKSSVDAVAASAQSIGAEVNTIHAPAPEPNSIKIDPAGPDKTEPPVGTH